MSVLAGSQTRVLTVYHNAFEMFRFGFLFPDTVSFGKHIFRDIAFDMHDNFCGDKIKYYVSSDGGNFYFILSS